MCHHEGTKLAHQQMIMLEFFQARLELKFTGKIRPAPFRGVKQAKFKVTGKKVKEKTLKNLSPQRDATCQPKNDHVTVVQASWVIVVYWKNPTCTI